MIYIKQNDGSIFETKDENLQGVEQAYNNKANYKVGNNTVNMAYTMAIYDQERYVAFINTARPKFYICNGQTKELKRGEKVTRGHFEKKTALPPRDPKYIPMTEEQKKAADEFKAGTRKLSDIFKNR